jgi:hypothetical protein
MADTGDKVAHVTNPSTGSNHIVRKGDDGKLYRQAAHGLVKEDVDLEEAKEDLDINKVLAYAKKIGGDVKGSTIDFGQGSVIKVSVAGDKIKFDGGKSSGIETFKSSAAAIAALGKGIDEEADLDEAKAADPANLRSIIANHTALLSKADKPEAKEFHKVAIANAKEKLKALGEEVELEESYYTPRDPEAKKALELVIDNDDVASLVQFMKGLSTYYVDFGKQNEQPDSIAFGKHLTAAYNIIKDWH